MENWFANWFNSPYYHLLYQHRDEEEAQAFMDALIDELQPSEGAHVLDLACGKGRHSIYLAEKGLDVVGLDLAEESIRAAQASKQEHLQFGVHDMREPLPFGPYDYIFNLFTSFGYFESEEEHLLTLKHIFEALKPGGYLLIDFLNATKVIQGLVGKEKKALDDVHFRIRRYLENGVITKEIAFETGGQRHHYKEKVWGFDLNDFERFFEAVGLELIETWGNYELQPYRADTSKRLILLAQKPQ